MQAATPQSPAAAPAPAIEPHRALLNQYCTGCHNERLKTAGLLLDKADLARVPENAELWEKVVRRLRAGTMPPQGLPRPDNARVDAFATWLETSLDQAAKANPNPGRALPHRLNRAEYANAVRDLLALEVDPAQLLPSDDESYGFDNIADVLKLSPVLLERYLSAAWNLSRLAVGDPGIQPAAATYRVRPDLSQNDHVDGLPLGTQGGIMVRHNFPLDGEYIIKVRLWRTTQDQPRGLEEPHKLEVTLDSARVFLASIGGKEDYDAVVKKFEWQKFDDRLTVRIPVHAGPRQVGVAFLQQSEAENDLALQPFLRSTIDPVDYSGLPHIDRLTISGPFKSTGSGDTPSRRQVFTCRPASASDELPCAKQIVSALARRAFRRPLTANDIETLLGYYQKGRNKGTFDTGIEMAIRAILADPEFVTRFESTPPSVAANAAYRVSDPDLASRLSFFLWSSVPDDELLNLAAQGKLDDPAVLQQQVRRMLADPRSEALVKNFASQWLYLRNLRSITPDPQEFPDFDDNLRQAYQRETELFFQSILREDRSVVDLLNANYTFVNERLAKQYGIPNIAGTAFRRVTLTDEARWGILGKGSTLMVTSLATRTSPVLRGKWILTNVLGTPPMAPPPNVPPLKENKEGDKALSVRERMEAHRASPACAGCHKIMDPLGFSLENFDAVGTWRTKSEAGTAVDASGQLADGTAVDGPVSLRRALMRHPDQFVRTVSEKLLIYALGRGLEYYDMPALRGIVRDASEDGYRFSAVVLGIVKSTPFQMRKNFGEGENRSIAVASAAASSAPRAVLASSAAQVTATQVTATQVKR